MSGDYTPKAGDRVRVVIEDVVDHVDHDNLHMRNYCFSLDDGTASFELTKPAVEMFGPGDTVRSKYGHRFVYSIGHGGYFSHQSLDWCAGDESFNSEHYVKVTIG